MGKKNSYITRIVLKQKGKTKLKKEKTNKKRENSNKKGSQHD